MILVVTNRLDYTADYLILGLIDRKLPYWRLNTEDFPTACGLTWRTDGQTITGHLQCSGRAVDFEEIQTVWYRRPVPPVPAATLREPDAVRFAAAESRAALDSTLRTLPARWVSDPENIRRAENKLLQLQHAQRLGFAVWPTLVTTDPDEARTFHDKSGPCVYKTLSGGRFESAHGVRQIFTSPVDDRHLAEFDRIRLTPVLLQRRVPKLRDLRITVVGQWTSAVSLDPSGLPAAATDWRRVEEFADLRPEIHELPVDVAGRCRSLVSDLGLKFGAIDLILTPAGEYVFLEVNPNGQWAWLDAAVPGLDIRERLIDLLAPDRQRCGAG